MQLLPMENQKKSEELCDIRHLVWLYVSSRPVSVAHFAYMKALRSKIYLKNRAGGNDEAMLGQMSEFRIKKK